MADGPSLSRDVSRLSSRLARLEERVIALDRILQEREKQVTQAVASVARATDKAEEAQLRVNLAQNEFRGALKDQNDTKASVNDLTSLDKRVQNLERGASAGTGHSSGVGSSREILFQVLPLLLAAAAVVVAIVWH